MAFLLLLYQIATFAPASAKACATESPIPAPAPETIAVRPLSENIGITRAYSGADVLPCLKFPPTIAGLGGVAAIALVKLKFRVEPSIEAGFWALERLGEQWKEFGTVIYALEITFSVTAANLSGATRPTEQSENILEF